MNCCLKFLYKVSTENKLFTILLFHTYLQNKIIELFMLHLLYSEKSSIKKVKNIAVIDK